MRFNSIILTAFLATAALMNQNQQVMGSSSVQELPIEKLSRSMKEQMTHYEIRSIPSFNKHGMVKRRHHVKRCSADDEDDEEEEKKKKDEKKKHHDDKKEKKKHHDKKKTDDNASKDKQSDATTGSSGSASGVLGAAKGLFDLTFSGECQKPDATKESPNGNINFLNCGISKSNPNGKWSPPDVKMDQLKFVSSEQAAKSGVFSDGCGKYKSAFDDASKETGVPAVLLMSFSQQESSCNPSAKGGNGEIGMMQLTPDKCSSANCWDAATNIKMGAKYFKSLLDQYDGNVLESIGSYNGWYKGLTFSKATNQQYGCHSQNNLDYLNQMLNGWTQGKNGDKMLVYNNLASCSN